ncbi:MAG: hypothetical protein OHK0046_23360 [Anaerolineae bacterium]
MKDQPKNSGRSPRQKKRGRPLNIYLSEAREKQFVEVFDLMKAKGILPSTADLNRSRTLIIDHALDALKARLLQDE